MGMRKDLAAGEAVGEGGVGGFGAEVEVAADVALAGVAHERAGEQAGLAEDLEAVADAHDEAAGRGEAGDGLHDGGEAGDGAGAQVVAVGEAAGDEDGVAAFEGVRLVPEVGDGLAEDGAEDVVGVVVAVGAGEDEDAELHGDRVAEGGFFSSRSRSFAALRMTMLEKGS